MVCEEKPQVPEEPQVTPSEEPQETPSGKPQEAPSEEPQRAPAETRRELVFIRRGS